MKRMGLWLEEAKKPLKGAGKAELSCCLVLALARMGCQLVNAITIEERTGWPTLIFW